MDTLYQQTIKGFYGHPSTSHVGVTSSLCKDIIDHCHRWCSDWIKQDNPHLTGSLGNLTVLPRNQSIIVHHNQDAIADDDHDEDAVMDVEQGIRRDMDPFSGEEEDIDINSEEADSEDDITELHRSAEIAAAAQVLSRIGR
jgi:hypothetical protein